MTTKIRLQESVKAPFTKKGNRWLVVVAAPGRGMSGQYSRETLMEQGPVALPPGTRSYIGHAMPQDRDPRDQLGKFPDGVYYDDNYDREKFPQGALVGELLPRAGYRTLLEELEDDGELSIFLDGEKDHEGNVLTMIPARWNSVDLVAFGGIEGAGLKEKLYESFRLEDEKDDKPGSTSDQIKKEGSMDPETKAAFDALLAKVNELSAALAAIAPVDKEALQAEVDADAVEAEVAKKVDEALEAYEEQVAKIDAEKELLPSHVETLKAEARKGKDVAPLIESYKAQFNEFKTAFAGDGNIDSVRITESLSSDKDDDFTVSRWKK